MKTKSAKQKGRYLQYWVCKKICELYDVVFDQQNDQCPVHSREMGQSGVDICIRDKRIYDNFLYDIECKNTEKIEVYKFIGQAKKNTKCDRQWLIVHKKNRTKPIVIMDAEHFFELIKKIRG
jgi:hypothetical protein